MMSSQDNVDFLDDQLSYYRNDCETFRISSIQRPRMYVMRIWVHVAKS